MRKSTESDEISLHFSMNKKTAVDGNTLKSLGSHFPLLIRPMQLGSL